MAEIEKISLWVLDGIRDVVGFEHLNNKCFYEAANRRSQASYHPFA